VGMLCEETENRFSTFVLDDFDVRFFSIDGKPGAKKKKTYSTTLYYYYYYYYFVWLLVCV
jgi:hypothetical protein